MIYLNEITLDLDGVEIKIRINLLKKKACMRLVHQFVGALQKSNGQITQVDFDFLDDISSQLFKGAFVLKGTDSQELDDDFWADKLDLWYDALAKALEMNAPDFFQRMERKLS
jgi:hypothetical protein